MQQILTEFPKLQNDPYFRQTSPETPNYNCIAWAVEDATRWWWPDISRLAYWPRNIVRMPTVEAFTQMLANFGYVTTDDISLVEGIKKVAIYGDSEEVKHASRMLRNGAWTSKLGQSYDIQHSLETICGNSYGEILRLFQKQI